MDTFVLKAQARDVSSKRTKDVRQQGLVPGVIYGKSVETLPIQMQYRELAQVLKTAGRHSLISLEVEGNESYLTLAREIQRDLIKHNYLHVDFFAVRMDKKVKVKVPVSLHGRSPAVAVGGVMTYGIDSVYIECLPSDLPKSIEVDLGQLDKYGASIEVRDLEYPDTMRILSDSSSMIVKVEPPRKK